MKPLRPVKKWVLTAIAVSLALLMLKIIWLLSARPKVTVDYVAEYNRISRPKDFDPNQNAARDYQMAFDSFIEMPGPGSFNFDERRYYRMPRGQSIRTVGWPKDFNDADQNALRQWLASNEQAFEYFRAASVKPYYWIEREDKENKGIIGVPMPELGNLRNLADAMTWNAKAKAADGQYQDAFEDILTCYRIGRQNCRNPSLLMKQFFILVIKERVLNAALTIIDRVKLEPSDLKNFQDSLQAELDRDTYIVGFETEKLYYYDILQRTFVYNSKGTGRLACSEARKGGRLHFKPFLSCLIGPTKNEMRARIDEIFSSFESVRVLTPWQLHLRDRNYFEKLNLTRCDNCYDFGLDMFFPSYSFSQLHRRFYRQKAREEALLTILAVHRFKARNGSFPASLDEIVLAGYLRRMPPDPFSDGPLVYRVDENDFTLYSVGDDFKDDGGKTSESSTPGFSYSRGPLPDTVFWPPARPQPQEKPPAVKSIGNL